MIAAGDGFNDIEMMDYVGLAVAVQNAADEVKKHADVIGCSNNEGIIDYIVNTIIKK